MTTFAELTTIGVGGPIARFIEPTTRVGVIEAIEEADAKGLPLCVIGGGSNMLVSDAPFPGVVVRDARRAITVPDEAAPVEGGDRTVHVNAEAGCNWDDFVAFTVQLGLEGVEGLSGIPGTVGASVVQNIGAYGQEVGASVESVEVWDRRDKRTTDLTAQDLKFGYRSSALKSSMYAAPATPAGEFFPTPRYVVLSVTFALRHSATGTVGYRRPHGDPRHPQRRAQGARLQGHAGGRGPLPEPGHGKHQARRSGADRTAGPVWRGGRRGGIRCGRRPLFPRRHHP